MQAPFPPGLQFLGGTVYARGFRVTQSTGGILIDGAAFDLRNIDVSGNDVGDFGLTKWGGILVNNPASPAMMRDVSITNNAQIGLVCSTTIDIDGTVIANNNVGGDIDSACIP